MKHGPAGIARWCKGQKARAYLACHRMRRRRIRVKRHRSLWDDIRISPFALTIVLFLGFVVTLIILSLIED